MRSVAWKRYEEAPRNIQAAVQALARTHGVALDPLLDPDEGFQWNGKVIAAKKQEMSSVIHDIAHYAVCPAWRRRKPDFGLGSGPDSGGNEVSEEDLLLVSSDYAQCEEELASVLGIVYEYEIGIDPYPTIELHQWTSIGSGRGFWGTLEDLEERRLVKRETVISLKLTAVRRGWDLPIGCVCSDAGCGGCDS